MKNIRPQLHKKHEFCFYSYLKNSENSSFFTSVKEVIVPKNEIIYKPPFAENYMYEVVQGVVKLGGYSETGEENTYDVIYSGDYFGNLKYLNGQFFEFSKTLVDSKIRIYDLAFFKKTIIENPVTSEWFIAYLLKRWCLAEKKLGQVNERSTFQKLEFLKSHFNIPVLDIHGEEHLLYNLLTQKDKGDLIGATRQTIANALKKKSVFIG